MIYLTSFEPPRPPKRPPRNSAFSRYIARCACVFIGFAYIEIRHTGYGIPQTGPPGVRFPGGPPIRPPATDHPAHTPLFDIHPPLASLYTLII